MKNSPVIFAAIFLLTASGAVFAQSSPLEAIAESHIRANVPEPKDFDSFLKRDLEAYFKEQKKKDVVVEYQLLREGATQTGISFPKFYAWVVLRENGAFLDEGAVKVAAMEKKQFAVLDYLPKADIERDMERVYQIFPKPVGDKIKARVAKQVMALRVPCKVWRRSPGGSEVSTVA